MFGLIFRHSENTVSRARHNLVIFLQMLGKR